MASTALLSGSACCFCFLLSAFCSLLSASLFLLLLVFASCFLLSLASAFCLLLLASCFLLPVVFAFCFLLSAFMCFGQKARTFATKLLLFAITTATITVTLTKDSHYSFFKIVFFIVANTITGAIITSSFPVANERASRNNKRASKRKNDKRTSRKQSTHKCCNLQYS